MENKINQLYKDVSVIGFLTLALFALLWAPFEWILTIDSHIQSASADALTVAQKFKYLWPTLVGGLLAGGFFAYKGTTWLYGVSLPLVLTTILIFILSFFYYVIPLLVLFIPGGSIIFLLSLILWPYLFYSILRRILKRKFQGYVKLSDSKLERFALFALFGVPQVLCHFGFFINHDWYITVP